MTRMLASFAFLVLITPGAAPGPTDRTAPGVQACPDPAALTADLAAPFAHVRYLADDTLEGREAGTDGAR